MGYNLGRTAIHEIGHWLNPGHTFNDLADDGLRDKRCFDSDGVMDTPCQMKDSNGCMYNSHGCGLPHDVIPEALNNFMDYQRDLCSLYFTHGRTERMHKYWSMRYQRKEVIRKEPELINGNENSTTTADGQDQGEGGDGDAK